jgi:hypothetical protein
MKDLTQILEYYPKLKEKINKDIPQIYKQTTGTQYVKNAKLNPNIGLIYDFGGTDDPVKGKNVVIVDYDPDEDTSNISSINDKDLTIYKYEAKDPNVKLPNTLEVKGKLFIAYANILNFPKVLKAKSFKIFSCEMKDNLFNSKLLIDGDLDILSVSYNGTNIMNDLKTPEVDTMDKLIDKIRNLIENNGGYVNGDIKVNNVRF